MLVSRALNLSASLMYSTSNQGLVKRISGRRLFSTIFRSLLRPHLDEMPNTVRILKTMSFSRGMFSLASVVSRCSFTSVDSGLMSVEAEDEDDVDVFEWSAET